LAKGEAAARLASVGEALGVSPALADELAAREPRPLCTPAPAPPSVGVVLAEPSVQLSALDAEAAGALSGRARRGGRARRAGRDGCRGGRAHEGGGRALRAATTTANGQDNRFFVALAPGGR